MVKKRTDKQSLIRPMATSNIIEHIIIWQFWRSNVTYASTLTIDNKPKILVCYLWTKCALSPW